MRVDIYHYSQNVTNGKLVHDLVPTHLGYIEIENFDAEEIFNLCNWSHWMEEKPLNLHSNIRTCGHGLCLINTETKERWLAKSFGWLVGDEKTISNYVLDNRYSPIWI